MDKTKAIRLTRDDWLQAALKMSVRGIDSVKIAPLATSLGVNTGSFYWHSKNRGELLQSLLERRNVGSGHERGLLRGLTGSRGEWQQASGKGRQKNDHEQRSVRSD